MLERSPDAPRVGLSDNTSGQGWQLLSGSTCITFRILAAVVVIACVSLALPKAASGAAVVFQTDMHGENMVPPVTTGAWGFVRFFFNDARTEADYTVDVKGISSSLVTGADLFRGPPGANGSLVRHLAEGGFLTYGGHLKLTPSEAQDFASGAFYAVLYTTRHPEGELRGQVYVPCGFFGPPPPGCSDPQFAGIAAPVELHSQGGGASNVLPGPPPPGPPDPPPPANVGPPPGRVEPPPAASGPRADAPPTAPGTLRPPNTGDGGLISGDPKTARAVLVGLAAVIIGVGLIVLSGSPGRE
jgi:CHRD domain-containing protein